VVILWNFCWQEKFRKLLDINESLGETVDLISPTRELIKEGKILRVAARDGGKYERYMFLVSSVFVSEYEYLYPAHLSKKVTMHHSLNEQIHLK